MNDFNLQMVGNKDIAEKPTKKITSFEFPDFNDAFTTNTLLSQISARAAAIAGKKVEKKDVAKVIGVKIEEPLPVSEYDDEDVMLEPPPLWADLEVDDKKKENHTFNDFFKQDYTQDIIETLANEQDKWGKLLLRFKPHFSVPFYQLLLSSAIIRSQANIVTLGFSFDDLEEIKKHKKQLETLKSLMEEVSKRKIQLEFERYDQTPENAPKRQRQAIFEQKRDEAWEHIENSPQFSLLQAAFGAELVKEDRFFALVESH